MASQLQFSELQLQLSDARIAIYLQGIFRGSLWMHVHPPPPPQRLKWGSITMPKWNLVFASGQCLQPIWAAQRPSIEAVSHLSHLFFTLCFPFPRQVLSWEEKTGEGGDWRENSIEYKQDKWGQRQNSQPELPHANFCPYSLFYHITF